MLRDPARRRAYDESRSPQGGEADTGRLVPGMRASMVETEGLAETTTLEDPEDTTEAEPPSGRVVAWLLAPVLAVAVAAAVVAVAIAMVGPWERQGLDVETTDRFPVGSCVSVETVEGGEAERVEAVSEVACTDAASWVVVDRVGFPRPCPLDTRAVIIADQDISLCLERGGR